MLQFAEVRPTSELLMISGGISSRHPPKPYWCEERFQVARQMWMLSAIPLWRIARFVETPLADFSTLTRADPTSFPIHRCDISHIPCAEDLLVERESISQNLSRMLALPRQSVDLVATLAENGRTLGMLMKTTGIDIALLEIIVRAFGFSPPPRTPAGLAQFRQITTIHELAHCLQVDVSQVLLVQDVLARKSPLTQSSRGRLCQDSINLITEWSGLRARWRTTILRRRWWQSAEAILRGYDAGKDVKQLARELRVECIVLYDFLHRHGRRPQHRLQQRRHSEQGRST